MSNILFIAGGPWQLPFVEYLKSKNYTIFIVNPLVTKTTKICDYHIQCDINDINHVYEHVKNKNINFVTSDQSDVATMAVAKLSNLLNTPGNHPEVIEKFSNKFVMWQETQKLGINAPKSVLVKKVEDLHKLIDEVGFPVICKPVDATNSRGFRKINNHHEINVDESLKYSKSRTAIGQQYVEGDAQITLDGICNNNRHKTLAISKKGDYFKPGLTKYVRYPANMNESLLDKITRDNDSFIEKAGLKFGLTHGEYIVDTKTEKYWFIECAARGAGAGITSYITPWVSGINSYDILHTSLLGNSVNVKELQTKKRAAILQFYTEEEVPVDKTEKIMKIPGVQSFLYNYRREEFATDSFNCRHSLGIYLAENDKELDEIIEKCRE